MSKIECLIVRQPYASLISFGKKRWEFRRYDTKKRGRIGIAAAAGEPWYTLTLSLNKLSNLMPRGVVLATAELINTFYITNRELKEIQCGTVKINLQGKEIITLDEPIGEPPKDVEIARNNERWESFVWVLNNVEQLQKPIPFKGKSGSTWVEVTI